MFIIFKKEVYFPKCGRSYKRCCASLKREYQKTGCNQQRTSLGMTNIISMGNHHSHRKLTTFTSSILCSFRDVGYLHIKLLTVTDIKQVAMRVLIGVILSLCGYPCISLSITVQKHVQRTPHQHHFLHNALNIIFIVIAEVCNFLA